MFWQNEKGISNRHLSKYYPPHILLQKCNVHATKQCPEARASNPSLGSNARLHPPHYCLPHRIQLLPQRKGLCCSDHGTRAADCCVRARTTRMAPRCISSGPRRANGGAAGRDMGCGCHNRHCVGRRRRRLRRSVGAVPPAGVDRVDAVGRRVGPAGRGSAVRVRGGGQRRTDGRGLTAVGADPEHKIPVLAARPSASNPCRLRCSSWLTAAADAAALRPASAVPPYADGRHPECHRMPSVCIWGQSLDQGEGDGDGGEGRGWDGELRRPRPLCCFRQ